MVRNLCEIVVLARLNKTEHTVQSLGCAKAELQITSANDKQFKYLTILILSNANAKQCKC